MPEVLRYSIASAIRRGEAVARFLFVNACGDAVSSTTGTVFTGCGGTGHRIKTYYCFALLIVNRNVRKVFHVL
ncbi:MAG: hypothetical protein P8105_06990 [Dehalococcoidia bacterium]